MEDTQNNYIDSHYYGDQIRMLFIITGVLMAASLPFFSALINVPVIVSLISIVALAVLGGFLNPVQKWIIVANTVVSGVAFIAFEYYAVNTYLYLAPDVSSHIYFYWTNQILALLFFVSLYLCIKTLRGKMLAK